MQQKIDHFL